MTVVHRRASSFHEPIKFQVQMIASKYVPPRKRNLSYSIRVKCKPGYHWKTLSWISTPATLSKLRYASHFQLDNLITFETFIWLIEIFKSIVIGTPCIAKRSSLHSGVLFGGFDNAGGLLRGSVGMVTRIKCHEEQIYFRAFCSLVN